MAVRVAVAFLSAPRACMMQLVKNASALSPARTTAVRKALSSVSDIAVSGLMVSLTGETGVLVFLELGRRRSNPCFTSKP